MEHQRIHSQKMGVQILFDFFHYKRIVEAQKSRTYGADKIQMLHSLYIPPVGPFCLNRNIARSYGNGSCGPILVIMPELKLSGPVCMFLCCYRQGFICTYKTRNYIRSILLFSYSG